MSKTMKDRGATYLGIATSVSTALAVLDWDNLDFSLPSTYVKIILLALPAVGGSVSTLK